MKTIENAPLKQPRWMPEMQTRTLNGERTIHGFGADIIGGLPNSLFSKIEQ
jgi:hypothetical protein